jgi:hypothetical protein
VAGKVREKGEPEVGSLWNIGHHFYTFLLMKFIVHTEFFGYDIEGSSINGLERRVL